MITAAPAIGSQPPTPSGEAGPPVWRSGERPGHVSTLPPPQGRAVYVGLSGRPGQPVPRPVWPPDGRAAWPAALERRPPAGRAAFLRRGGCRRNAAWPAGAPEWERRNRMSATRRRLPVGRRRAETRRAISAAVALAGGARVRRPVIPGRARRVGRLQPTAAAAAAERDYSVSRPSTPAAAALLTRPDNTTRARRAPPPS